MVAFVLGMRSRQRLEGVHRDLIRVVERAIQITSQDFTVTEGVRTLARQRELYAQGRTKPGKIVTKTLNSKHRVQKDGYGHAVDMPPFPISWDDTPENLARFDAVAKAMFEAAKIEGVLIRWGANWDMDGNWREKGETDSPHFELVP